MSLRGRCMGTRPRSECRDFVLVPFLLRNKFEDRHVWIRDLIVRFYPAIDKACEHLVITWV